MVTRTSEVLGFADDGNSRNKVLNDIVTAPRNVVGDVSVSLEFLGDFGEINSYDPNEYFMVDIEGYSIGDKIQGYQSQMTNLQFTINSTEWIGIIADGKINITYTMGSDVDNTDVNPNEFIRLKFTWNAPVDPPVVVSPIHFIGTSGTDILTGTSGQDIFDALGGRDTVYAGNGNDAVSGGAGSDTLHGEGGDDTITGEDGDDAVFGGSGNDKLDGGRGNDKLSGGDGSDTLLGGEDDDKVYGGKGSDQIYGGKGHDVLGGGEAGDTLIGEEGRDTLYGGAGNDRLEGGKGHDHLFGGLGFDILVGGSGRDLLSGGRGADMFQFTSVNDSGIAAKSRDTIFDFSQAEGDKIDLSKIGLDHGSGSEPFFRFIGNADFSGKEGQIRYEIETGKTIVLSDIDGDGDADFSIALTGSFNPTANDFIL